MSIARYFVCIQLSSGILCAYSSVQGHGLVVSYKYLKQADKVMTFTGAVLCYCTCLVELNKQN